MKPKLYIETTVVSYLMARPSRDLIRSAQQQSTREWWEQDRGRYDLVTSGLTLVEAGAGDPSAAAEWLRALEVIPQLAATGAADELAAALVRVGAFPAIASRDALHVAIAATNGVEYLLTWNFKHLANAALRDKIRVTCEVAGVECPVICTPDELKE